MVETRSATRSAMPAWKRPEAIFFHPPVKRGAGEAQRLGRPADIIVMALPAHAQWLSFSTWSRRDDVGGGVLARLSLSAKGKSASPSIVASLRITARSTAWRSARTLPGQE